MPAVATRRDNDPELETGETGKDKPPPSKPAYLTAGDARLRPAPSLQKGYSVEKIERMREALLTLRREEQILWHAMNRSTTPQRTRRYFEMISQGLDVTADEIFGRQIFPPRPDAMKSVNQCRREEADKAMALREKKKRAATRRVSKEGGSAAAAAAATTDRPEGRRSIARPSVDTGKEEANKHPAYVEDDEEEDVEASTGPEELSDRRRWKGKQRAMD